jgi:hypothetical protein
LIDGDNGGTVGSYALSFLQSLFVVRASGDATRIYSVDEQIDTLNPPNTFAILDRAVYHLTKRDDMTTAIKLVCKKAGIGKYLICSDYSIFCAASRRESLAIGFVTRACTSRHGKRLNCCSHTRPPSQCALSIDRPVVYGRSFQYRKLVIFFPIRHVFLPVSLPNE